MKKKENNPNSRRKFIRNTALSLAGFYIVPRHVLGGKGYISPSDKLNIAGVGVGGKGTSDIANAYNKGANNIVAMCDVDWGGSSKASATKFPDAKRYSDFRKMLETEKGIDAVTVSTPDHMHAVIAMTAMQLGKHVYVQKPLTHDIYEARMLTEAARNFKVVTQMGNQGASGEGTKQMGEWFDKGLIGTVSEAHVWTNRPVWPQGIPVPTDKPKLPDAMPPENWDLWVGTAPMVDYHPLYHPFKWRGWWNFGTGALGDMACHLLDPAYRTLGLGYPTEVECSVGQVFIKDWSPEYIPEGCPPSSLVQLKFPASKKNKSIVKLNWQDGGLRPFHPELIPADDPLGEPDSSNGVLLIGTKGIMVCETYGINPRIYKNNGEKIEVPKAATDPGVVKLPENGHQAKWAEACKTGFGSELHKGLTSSFDFAGPLTESILMGNLAIRSYNLRQAGANGRGFTYPGRKKLLWDGTNMKITNFEDANQFVKRTYREGWSLGKGF
jgi:predicted dehydrogenase